MNKRIPLTLAAAVLAATGTVTAQAAGLSGKLSGNIGLTNNYLFRGVTQTSDQAAVQGGLDYEHDSGFYAGTWLSNVGSGAGALYTAGNPGNFEQDWYGGYGFAAGGVDLDVGVILYTYPVGPGKFDYAELYVNGSWEWLTGGIAYTFDKEDSAADTGDLYIYVSGELEAKNGLGYGFTLGRYDFKGGSAADYTHFRLYMDKNDFTVALEKNNADEAAWFTGVDDLRFTVSWSKSFEL